MPVHGGIYEIWLGSSTLLGSTFHLHSYQKSASIFLFVGLRYAVWQARQRITRFE
jgi:hypothetical protein